MDFCRIITDSEQLRAATGSWWANADFSRIAAIVNSVEMELEQVVGTAVMTWLTAEGRSTEARLNAACAVGYMACMRYYRLNDISHDTGSRRVKIDHDNEARPFEWQLARDDRAHLDEYYRALDRLLYNLQSVEAFCASATYQQMQRLIVRDAASLTWLTGADNSHWLFFRLTPYMAESQDFVEKAYGEPFTPADFQPFENTDTVAYAAQKAVALGAIALMGRRTSLQQMPYALMQLIINNGGNQQLQPTADQLAAYLRTLSADQHYWLNEMKTRRDTAAVSYADTQCQPTYLQVPENLPSDKRFRL